MQIGKIMYSSDLQIFIFNNRNYRNSQKRISKTQYKKFQTALYTMSQDKTCQEFKKEALQFIMSIYLQRQNDQDIRFIQQNVKKTSQFAKNVNSDIKYGLSYQSVQRSKIIYGKNAKRYVKNYNLKDVVMSVIKIHYVLVFVICIVQAIFGAVLSNKQIYMDAIYALVLLCFVLLIRIGTIYLNQKKKSQESYQKNKKQKYRVFRDGNFIEIPQTKIVVGDIVELDYKEKVPACGILITNHQIAMNQEKYGKGVQRKMCIEKCISYIKKLSALQLKIDAQINALPSPILLRGTQQIYGSSYRILILTVNEENLLDKHKIQDDSTFASDVIRNWFQKTEIRIKSILKIICIVYLILFLSLFGLKEFLQRRHLSGQVFFTDLFSVLLMSIIGFSVFDTNCLRIFFQAQVINYTQNLYNPKQVDKYLTVQQVYITEDNIVKYDEIIVCRLGLPDKQNLINYQDINILPQITKAKIQQVLSGVGLTLSQKSSTGDNQIFKIKQSDSIFQRENRLNQIIHLNTVDQKIFSCLYNKSQDNQDERQRAMNNFVKSEDENASNISLNKITPMDEQGPFAQIKKTKFRKKQMLRSKLSDANKQQNQESLKGYLGQFCKFKTQNIVQSIVQLAKQQSRTYYYQKYSFNRLKRINSVYINGNEFQMNKERIQKLKRTARNIRVNESLTPFLIGYSDGAYNNNSMNVLVGIVAVKINYQNEIIQRLKQLSKLGVNSTVLIHKRQEEQRDPYTKDNFMLQSKVTGDACEEEDYNKIILSEYMNRGWISQQAEQMIDFPTLKQSGGMIRCENCYLSSCDCKNKIQVLSNVQGFMSATQNTKIIHSVQNQADIHYLKIGSQQIKNTVLLITKYKSDTIKILQDIKRGYQLPNILQRGLNVWYGFMFVSALCFYPLALISFGGVFCSGDLSLWNLFIQLLPAIGNLNIQIEQKQKIDYSTRRKKILYSNKSTISVFLLCIISTVVATVIYIKPNLFIEESLLSIAHKFEETYGMSFDQVCTYQFSIFLSNQFNKLECKDYSEDIKITPEDTRMPAFIYSQNVNFIFSYLCLNMFIFFIINFQNFTRIKVIGVYTCFLAIFLMVIYGIPDIIHGRHDGLTPGQLAIVFGMSILTNLIIQSIVYFSNYSCSVCDTDQFQSVLTFEQNIQTHYSSKLKKYSNFQTDTYTLN